MKKQCKLSILILVLVSIFLLSIVNFQTDSTQEGNNEESLEKKSQDKTRIDILKTSDFWSNCHRIHIYQDNWSATDLDWIQNRTGTYNDPHIIENVTISGDSSGNGIFIEDSSDYFIVRNCIVYNVYNGILLEYTANGTLANNNCSHNSRGIRLRNYCSNITIVDNIANNNNRIGIVLEDHCDNNRISGNIVCGPSQNNGIRLIDFCDNNIISGNTANNNSVNGIYLHVGCNDNTISGNTANNNSVNGIYLYGVCNDNTISGNTAINNVRGIYLETSCDDNTISRNNISYNDKYGIFFIGCVFNTISENIIKNNTQLGIELESHCNNNLLYYNAFIDNGIHANDDGTNNEWDNSEVGNYWDNYTVPDFNNNGIVDNPYTWITGSASSEDAFPLTESPVHLGAKIHIDDTGVSAWNWSKTAKLKAWCSGTGIYSDPYLIDGVEINGSGSGNGILIGNSSVYFTIENCKVYNVLNGITLENTGNGTLTHNNCSNNNHRGIWLHDNCRNNTLLDNTANSNSIVGIILEIDCDNNTISDNIACGLYQNNGIHLIDECDNNNISLNTLNENHDYGIYLDDECDNNTISGNTANDNDKYGIFLAWYCDYNTISGNTANDNDQQGMSLARNSNYNSFSGNTINDNGDYGIYLSFDCIDNHISGNTINDNGDYGIYLIFVCNKSNILDNYLYFNTNGAIWIVQANCEDTIVERNVMVSENKNFIIDDGTNTCIDGNLYLTSPSLCLEIVNQSFSTTEFNIIIRIFDSFNFSDILFDGFDLGLYYYFHIESIQMWWNGTVVPSSNITELGNDLYNISLSPKFVEPGDDPILLNMTISATHHSDKYFERYLAVDPEAVEKGPESGELFSSGSSGGGGGDGDKAAEIDGIIVILLTVGVASAIGLTAVAIILIRRRMGIENR